MQLELTGRHVEVTPALRRLVERKILKLERLLNDSAVSAHVVLAREKHRHLSEITLHARGEHFMHAVGEAGGWEASLSDTIEKLRQQVTRLKGKWKERTRRGARVGALEAPASPASADVAPGGASRKTAERPRMPRVLRASRKAIKPMSVGDAIRTLDGDRDGIVVFLDTDTAVINVLYRGHNGELSLLEIEV